jgi:VWFA-related protein
VNHRSSLIVLGLLLGLVIPVCDRAAVATEGEVVGGLTPADPKESRLTRLTVCVRDAEDQPIPGLVRDNFRVSQDGEEVPITVFSAFAASSVADDASEIEVPADPAGSAAVSSQQPEPVYITIFIDNPNLLLVERNRVLASLQSFARSIASEQVQMMVVYFDGVADIVQPFTNDEREVIHALRGLRMEEEGQDQRIEDRADIQRNMNRVFQNKSQGRSGLQYELRDLYHAIEVFMDHERHVLYGSLDAVYEVMFTLSAINERKHLVYVSNGLPSIIGRDLLYELSRMDSSSTGQTMVMPYTLTRRYQALADAANSFDVAIHTIDASGADHGPQALGAGIDRRSAAAHRITRENRQAALRMLAKKTGGLAVVDTDEFAAACDRLRDDMLTYYLLGLTFAGSGADKVHVIDVQLDMEQKHELRYRRTLIEKSLPSRVQDQVASALVRDVPGNDMGIAVSLSPWEQMTPEQWMLPVTVSVPVESVALVAQGDEYVGRVVVFFAARDVEGRRSDVVRTEHELRVPISEYESRRRGAFDIEHRMLLGTGRHSVAAGVLDETTQRASYDKITTASPKDS